MSLRHGNGAASLGEVVRVIDHLLVVSQDGVEGYRHAAAAVGKAPLIDGLLTRLRVEREGVVRALALLLESYGFEPAHHGSVTGAIHRRWLDLLGRMNGNYVAVLEECERGEEETINAFAHGLSRMLPPDVHAVLQEQLSSVLDAQRSLNRALVELTRAEAS